MIAAAMLLPLVGLGIRVAGLRRIQATLSRAQAGERPATAASLERARRIAGLVAAAARHGPYRAKCLPLSLALQRLLQSEGIASELRLGVRKSGEALVAHAWVEHGGTPLLEARDVRERFAAFDEVLVATRGGE
jgi:hypothetical protein